MAPKLLLLAGDGATPLEQAKFRELCRAAATFLGEPVVFALAAPDVLGATLASLDGAAAIEAVEPVTAAPMTAAPFVYREDGRPDWAAMWSTFCELALYGGPPHRGEDSPVEAPAAGEDAEPGDMVWEIRRGIAETTGLYSRYYAPGWLAVMCESRRMAAWLCAAIILENVEAWCEDTVLFVPAANGFRLQDEVKSVITVVAKTHHYWQQHVQQQPGDNLLLPLDGHVH